MIQWYRLLDSPKTNACVTAGVCSTYALKFYLQLLKIRLVADRPAVQVIDVHLVL